MIRYGLRIAGRRGRGRVLPLSIRTMLVLMVLAVAGTDPAGASRGSNWFARFARTGAQTPRNAPVRSTGSQRGSSWRKFWRPTAVGSTWRVIEIRLFPAERSCVAPTSGTPLSRGPTSRAPTSGGPTSRAPTSSRPWSPASRRCSSRRRGPYAPLGAAQASGPSAPAPDRAPARRDRLCPARDARRRSRLAGPLRHPGQHPRRR
jgi:hypothetical protein